MDKFSDYVDESLTTIQSQDEIDAFRKDLVNLMIKHDVTIKGKVLFCFSKGWYFGINTKDKV